jgi:hypothetical protein
MTLQEILTFEIKEEINEGLKQKVQGAIAGAGILLSLAAAAGIPQKAMLRYDVNQVMKEMPPSVKGEYERLYKLDEENGTNRSGAYMLRFIEETVEDGKGTDFMKKVYYKIHEKDKKNHFDY